ncbi:MAG TPA: 16S rRNA (cytidine(1402)-2'-O)-methyltransferase [Patescibacteria group bacterium]|nr:16S rRNA (cytidine(1402)-2'-O)-methyltransferase [Patescibacteria group bacterium]
MPTLYLVGTPIGNLEDISLRALRILGEVGLVAAEDTRVSGRLLKHYELDTPLISYHEHSDQARIAEIINKLSHSDIALISDAGMPGLSDPGYRLVQAAIQAGVKVVPVPGPSAAIAALVGSGLPTDKYLFYGFLPRQKKARQQALTTVLPLPYTLVFYEAPHRLLALLTDVEAVLGDRQVSIGRELTKLYEEIWRGSASAAIAYFGVGKIRGELTVVVEGSNAAESRWDEAAVKAAFATEVGRGVGRKAAAATISQRSGWRKREVYDLTLPE